MSLYELERNGEVGELVAVVRDSDNERLRVRAAEFLGNFAEHDQRDDAVGGLVEAAQDESAALAATAVDSLEELGGDALERLIADAAGAEFAPGAGESEGEGEDAEALPAASEAFRRALSHDRPELRMAAANALARIGDATALDALIDRFEDEDARVRARAARACGQTGDSEAGEALVGLLDDPAGAVRRAAAEALGYVGDQRALEALLPLYEDEDERVRRVAVDAFGNFENDRPVEYLVAALTDDSLAVRRTAVYSLVELLGNVPTDRSHDVRETVVEHLAGAEDDAIVEPWLEILERTTDPAQRRNTAWLLGRIVEDPDADEGGGETDGAAAAEADGRELRERRAERDRVIDALVDAMADDDDLCQQFATTSLVEIGGEAVSERLLAVATDEDRDPEVRAQAVFAVGKVGGEAARETLDGLIESAEEDAVRERAFSAIAKLGGRP